MNGMGMARSALEMCNFLEMGDRLNSRKLVEMELLTENVDKRSSLESARCREGSGGIESLFMLFTGDEDRALLVGEASERLTDPTSKSSTDLCLLSATI